MPLSAMQTYELEHPASMTQEAGNVTKRAIYTTAVATAASYLLGGESFSESSELFGMSIPNPLVAGISIGVGSALGKAVNDFVAPKLFSSASDDIKTTEKLAVETGFTIAGGLAGMNYLAGVPPNVTNAILAGGSYVGGSWVQNNLDGMLLGRLW